MLSVPHYLGSTLQWPTFIILSPEGLYLQQWRLAVIVFCTIQYWVCAYEFLSKKKTVCVLLFVTRRLLAALIHEAFGTCFRHLFLGPSPLWLSTFSKETWQPSRCECVCVFVLRVHVWLCVITFCIPPPPQVSVCWCLMGGLQKTLPGRCTWSSTRTAGEGPSLRCCSLLLRLLSFNLSALHIASPSLSSYHCGSSSLCPTRGTNMHTDNHTRSHVQYMYSTHAHIFPPSRGALLIFWKLQGGWRHMCHKCRGSSRWMAVLLSATDSAERERYISPSPGSPVLCL